MDFIVYGALVGLTYGLWTLSFSLIYRATKVFHVVHGATFTVAGYTFWALNRDGGNIIVAFVGAVVAAIAVGLASEWLIYRPLMNLGAHSGTLFLGSLGGYYVLQNLIQLIWRADVRTVMLPEALSRIVSLGGPTASGIELTGSLTGLVLWVGSLVLLRFTLPGKAVRAISVAPDMAELAGVRVGRIRLLVFAYGSALIGIAGIMSTWRLGITPAAGLPVWTTAVVASLIAKADPFWSFLVAIGLGLTENVSLLWISSGWQPAIPIVTLIVYLVGEAAVGYIQAWNSRRQTRAEVSHG